MFRFNIFRKKQKPLPKSHRSLACPRCGGKQIEYVGDKTDWVSINSKYRCKYCGRQFD